MQGVNSMWMRGYSSPFISTSLILPLPELLAKLLPSSRGACSRTAAGPCASTVVSQRFKCHPHKIRTDGPPKHCLQITLGCWLSTGGGGHNTAVLYMSSSALPIERLKQQWLHWIWKVISVTFNFVKVLRWVSRRIKILMDVVAAEARHSLQKHQDIKKGKRQNC